MLLSTLVRVEMMASRNSREKKTIYIYSGAELLSGLKVNIIKVAWVVDMAITVKTVGFERWWV